jgi:hypothetical protein
VLGLFSLLLVVATILIAWYQYRFQKNSHKQKLLLDRENRILDIYKVFADCGRVDYSGAAEPPVRRSESH